MRIDENTYRRIVDNLHEGLYFVDTDRVITYWNKAAERISGFSAEEVVGKRCQDNILTHIDANGHQLCMGLCPLAATIQDRELREAEVFLHHKDGHRVPVAVRCSPLTNGDGAVIGGVEIFTDISHREANLLRIKELEELAFLDPLTRLASRAYMEKELAIRLEESRRYGMPFGVLFVDVDHFKTFNDTWGHATGDQVLKVVADTISANGRPFDAFGRWGGEEFLGIIRHTGREGLAVAGERHRRAIAGAYIVRDDEKLTVTVSLGGAVFRPTESAENLVRRADEALYASKRAGRNRLTIAPE